VRVAAVRRGAGAVASEGRHLELLQGVDRVIFKAVRDGRPYPDHGLRDRDWAAVAPRSVRLDHLVSTRCQLALDKFLDKDSTFYRDLFPHVVQWQGECYLEEGLDRALRVALQQRLTLHARVLDLDGRAQTSPP
jgi:Arc/MetJ family transcription regulator